MKLFTTLSLEVTSEACPGCGSVCFDRFLADGVVLTASTPEALRTLLHSAQAKLEGEVAEAISAHLRVCPGRSSTFTSSSSSATARRTASCVQNRRVADVSHARL